MSRVGGAAQTKAMKSVAGKLKLDLAQFRELEAFAQLGTELDKSTQAQLDRGYRVLEVLKQSESNPWPMEEQVLSIFAVNKGYLDAIKVSEVWKFEEKLLEYMRTRHAALLVSIRNSKKIEDPDTVAKAIETFLNQYKESFAP